MTAAKEPQGEVRMSVTESWRSLQFLEAMKRTAVAVEGEDMWGFRLSLIHI